LSRCTGSSPAQGWAAAQHPTRAADGRDFGVLVRRLLSPLGLIAAGSVWDEWSAQDFANPQTRQEIARASGEVAPAAAALSALQQLRSWAAGRRR